MLKNEPYLSDDVLLKYMRSIIIFLFLFIGQSLSAQTFTHESIWNDGHTMQFHGNQYLGNYIGSSYLCHWDDSLQSFVSSVPNNLTYTPAANKELDVISYEIEYRDDYQLTKWDLFSPERMDSLLGKSKVLMTKGLKYDNQGRLLRTELKGKEYALLKERKFSTFQYSDSSITYTQFSKELNWFGSYLSSNAGLFKFRPFQKRNSGTTHYTFDDKNRMIRATHRYDLNPKRRKSPPPVYRTYDFKWDEKGRLLEKKYISHHDSVHKKLVQTYKEGPFILEEAAKEYPLLKAPSIQRWLTEEFAKEELQLVHFEGERYGGTWLVANTNNPLIHLHKIENARQTVRQTIVDSSSIFRARYTVSKFPDSMDVIPYDPNRKLTGKKVTYSQCSVTTTYNRPPGLIDAQSAEGFKKSYQKLNGGWTLIRYQRGDGNGHTRFAIGHAPFIRLDVLYTKYVILDPKGKVQYFGSYRKMAKVNW